MTYDWNFGIILLLLCVLAYVVIRLMKARKEITTVRKDMQGFAKSCKALKVKYAALTGRLSALLVALAEYEAASDVLDDPKIKRLKIEHPKRVNAQYLQDRASKALLKSKRSAILRLRAEE